MNEMEENQKGCFGSQVWKVYQGGESDRLGQMLLRS